MNFYNWGSSTSSTSSSNMSDETLELPIHIGGCQKWVTGLGRRTTCDDIIYALIRHEANPNEVVDVANYAIFEGWRGVERPLKGRTKILKVWKAWGAERHHVQFWVRKFNNPLDASIDLPMKPRRSRKSHSHCSKHRDKGLSSQNHPQKQHHHHHHQHQAKSNPTTRENSRVRGRREERATESTKDLTDIPKEPQTDSEKVKAKEFQDLVQRIIHQEKKIQEQLSRVNEMDAQIENYETKIHFMRVAENGQNYVQEAYLRDKSEESSSSTDDLFPTIKREDMDAYMHICDNILGLESKISHEQSKIVDLSIRIQEESVLESPPPLTLDHNDSSDSGNSSNPDERLISEVERMRKELERCMSVGEAQQHQLSLVNETLTECDDQLQKRRREIERLCAKVGEPEAVGFNVKQPPVQQTSDNDGGHKQGSSNRVTLAASSHSEIPRSAIMKSTATESEHEMGQKEQRGSSNFPPVTLTRTGDEAVDKALMDYYLTKSSHPSNSCTTQYMHQQNKQHNFDNDSNSDTGLSSLHSDDTPPMLETLV